MPLWDSEELQVQQALKLSQCQGCVGLQSWDTAVFNPGQSPQNILDVCRQKINQEETTQVSERPVERLLTSMYVHETRKHALLEYAWPILSSVATPGLRLLKCFGLLQNHQILHKLLVRKNNNNNNNKPTTFGFTISPKLECNFKYNKAYPVQEQEFTCLCMYCWACPRNNKTVGKWGKCL